VTTYRSGRNIAVQCSPSRPLYSSLQSRLVIPIPSILLWCKIVLLLVAAFLIPPAALSGHYTPVGLLLEAAALSVYIVETLLRGRIHISRNNVTVIIVGIALWSYVLAQAALVQSEGLHFVLKATVVNVTSIVVYGLLLGDAAANRIFFRAFAIILAACSASALVTALLSLFMPLSALYIGHLPIEQFYHSNAGDVYFPFSVRHGYYPVGNVDFPRFAGLFREAGILQAFLLWSAVYALNERFPKWLLIPILFGVILSLSTAGIALLPATLLLWLVLKARTDIVLKATLTLASCVISVFAFLYAPAIGMQDKSEVRGISVAERMEATVSGLSSAVENPLGAGMYGTLELPNAGINLLAATGQIGVLGFLLLLLVFMAPLVKSSNRAAYAVAVFPILMTGLLSQPLINAPLVYVILLAHFRSNTQVDDQETRTVSALRRRRRTSSWGS
jgi:hypothetical protein